MLFSFRGTKITKLFRGSAGIKLSRVVRTCESRGTNGARMFAREGLPGAILYRREIPDKQRWPAGFKRVGTYLAADAKKHNAMEIGG